MPTPTLPSTARPLAGVEEFANEEPIPAFPATDSFDAAALAPIPTLSVEASTNKVSVSTVKLVVKFPAPTTCRAVVGVIVPIPTLPEEFMVMPEVAEPAVIKPIEFEPIRYSPVSASLVNVKDGAAAVPSASDITPEIVGESFKAMVMDEPKFTSPPPVRLVPAVTATLELTRAELGILVKVLDEPDRDFLVRVWVVSVPTKVVVAEGRVNWKPPDESWLVVEDKVRDKKAGVEVVDTS